MRKKLLIVLLCCLCGFAAATGAAVWWTAGHLRSPEFREELVRGLEVATGREVHIRGPLKVSVFPWLGVEAEGFSLGNDPDFGAKPLLTAGEIAARVRVLPIFHRRLVFDIVDLKNATFSLVLNKKKRGNWEGVIETLRAQENAVLSEDDFFRKITVRGLRIENGAATLADERHGYDFSVAGLDLRTGHFETGRLLPFTFSCDFAWPQPKLVSRIEASGNFNWSGEAGTPVLEDATARAAIGGSFLPGGRRALVTTKVGTARRNTDLVLSDLRLKILGAEFAGGVTFFEVTDHYRMAARLRARPFDPRRVIEDYWPGSTAGAHASVLRKVQGLLNLYGDERGLTFESPGLQLDSSLLRGWVRMGFEKTPALNFSLSTNGLNADSYGVAFSGRSSKPPLAVADLPIRYLARLKSAGNFRAENLELAGMAMRGVNLSLKAGEGAYALRFQLDKTRWGRATGNLAAILSGGPAENERKGKVAAVDLGFSGSLRMDDVDVRQVAWLNRRGVKSSGQLDLRASVQAPKTRIPGNFRLDELIRRAAISVDANLNPVALAFPLPGRKAPAGKPQRMRFSSIQVRAKFLPVPAPPTNGDWAVRMSGTLSAMGVDPLLNMDANVSGVLQSGEKGGTVLSAAAAKGRLNGWFLPRRDNQATFSLHGGVNFPAQRMHLSAFAVQACGLHLLGVLNGTRIFGRDAALSGRIRCNRGDPKRLFDALDIHPPKAADRHVYAHVSGEADMTLNSDRLSLTNVSAQFDDIPVRGSYAVQDFSAPRQIFSLTAGVLDADRYLPPPRPVVRGVPEEKPVPQPLPVELVRSLSAEGTLALHSFKLHRLTTRGLKLSLAARNGHVSVKPMSGSFYGGELAGEFSADAQGQSLATRLALTVKNFQVGPFMLAWGGREYVTGRANVFMDLSGVGATDRDVLRTLSGLADFRITDGAYAFSGASDASPSGSRRSAQSVAKADNGRRGTEFRTAGAKLTVRQGVFRSDDFRLEGPSIVVTGKGKLSPADDTIALRLTAFMPGLPDVPLRVYGRLKDPEMKVPTIALINNTIKELLGLPFKPIKFFKDLLF